MANASAEALRRAWEIVDAGPRPAHRVGTLALALLLDELARLRGCAPSDVPLDVAGWWLAPEQLGLTLALLGISPGGQGRAVWYPDGDLETAWPSVEHAWMLTAGGLRRGDHVIVIPQDEHREAGPVAGNGVIDLLSWRGTRPPGDAPPGGRLDRDPYAVFTRPPGAPEGTRQALVPFWRVLPNPAAHPGETARVRALAVRSASAALLHASEARAGEPPGAASDWLRRRAAWYPADIAGFLTALADSAPDRDEIALARLRLPDEPPNSL